MWVNGKNIGFVYIIKITPRDRYKNKKSFDVKYYTGYTGRAIDIRYKEHLRRICSGYMYRYFYYGKKELVYVEIVDFIPHEQLPYFKYNGKYAQYHPREYEIKKMSKFEKEVLISSERNMLLDFRPNFGNPIVILKNGWIFHGGKVSLHSQHKGGFKNERKYDYKMCIVRK